MPLIEDIASIARSALSEDEKRQRIYALKVAMLVNTIEPLRDREIAHEGFTFRINSAQATPEHRLALDVTFARPPANPVTHQIIITNPPVLPRNRIDNEKEDLIAAIKEMLEGFV